mgnify:CR=1 FL=1
MIQAEWKVKITDICKEAGTYRPFFDEIINQLAQILEIRDNALVDFQKSGNSPVVVYTNKGGHSNVVKNPALAVINEQNQQALSYWRDLGLTPAGYKKLNGGEAIEQKQSAFDDMLSKLDL